MLFADIVIAGGGVSGLLIASALASKCSVLLLEQRDTLPRNKYWLTDDKSTKKNPQLQGCIDRHYSSLDFVAYDGLTATVEGSYCLWDTDKLISHLQQEASQRGLRLLMGHRLYSVSYEEERIRVRANSQVITTRLLIDCMGFGSPLVAARDIATIKGYYIMHGCEVQLRRDIRPIALDNVIVNRRPTYFELFPTSSETAHASIILPSRHFTPDRSIKGDLNFILGKSHHSEHIVWPSSDPKKSYFGIIPVGRLNRPALDRIVFFGEAGQTNPAASATGLTRMLYTYHDLATGLLDCLRKNKLGERDLLRAIPSYMTPMNRRLQEDAFERLLSFNSDDFRRLVQDLREYPSDAINDLMFADFDFRTRKAFHLFLKAFFRPGVMRSSFMKMIIGYCSLRR